MFEKVNPDHPDKVADRIAGAMVDMAYEKELNPRIAVEVLIGHGQCHIIAETSVHIDLQDLYAAVRRISKCQNIILDYQEVPQDVYLSANQQDEIRCGDNGIFCGVRASGEELLLAQYAGKIYDRFRSDGKYIIDQGGLIICQSNASVEDIYGLLDNDEAVSIAACNPLGSWTGGIDVDSGATNRKLGSDMGRAVTGGGLHGKDLSKADVSVNIWAALKAEKTGVPVNIKCAIGDEYVDGVRYSVIVGEARKFIAEIGGFEKFAEWGLIRP